MNATPQEIAVAFMRLSATTQEQLAKDMLIHHGNLPKHTDEMALEILIRVKKYDLVEDLSKRLGLEKEE